MKSCRNIVRALPVLAAIFGCLALPTTTLAAIDVQVVPGADEFTSGELRITDTAGTANVVTITNTTDGPTFMVISDAGAGGENLVAGGTACETVDGNIRCELNGEFDAIEVRLGIGNDSFSAAGFEPSGSVTYFLHGGDGVDSLQSGGGRAWFSPEGWGNDLGDDTYYGSSHHDNYYMGTSADGNDTVKDLALGDVDALSYAGRSTSINLRLSDSFAYATTGDGNELDRFDANFSTVGLGSAGDDVLMGTNEAQVDGNGGEDMMQGGPGSDELVGGPGNDTLRGGGGNDLLFGGTGDDDISGGDGNDTSYAEEGADGNDTLRGDAGIDTASYQNRIPVAGVGVYVTIGGGSDGTTGSETDDVQTTVENIVGTTGNDTLIGHLGAAVPNRLLGLAGNDNLYGHEGNDRLFAGTGIDRLYGGPQHDRLVVADKAKGDFAYCGYGTDWADRDFGDTVSSCETLV